MNINDYNSKNTGKQVLVLGEDDIKVLNHFASIAKSGELKGLIVAGKYVGFTDTYRLASIKDTHEDLPGTNTFKFQYDNTLSFFYLVHTSLLHYLNSNMIIL